MQEADDAAGKSFRVGDPVAGQAFAEITRFADIQDPLGGAAHQVHARHFGERAEEVLAEPLDKRPGRVEKPELSGSHAAISTRLDGNFQLRMRASEVEFKGYDAGHEIVQPMRDDIRAWLQNRSQ